MSRIPRKLGSTSALEVLKHAPVAMVVTTIAGDGDGQILFANQSALAMFGHAAHALDGQPFDRLLAAPSWPTRAALWRRYDTDPTACDDVPLCGLHHDGSELALRVSLGHTHSQGARVLIVSIQRDHDRTAEVDALRARLERMESIVQHVPLGLYECRAHGDFGATFVSEGVRAILGHAPDDYCADPAFWLEHVHPDDHPSVFEGLERMFETSRHTLEYRFRHENGSYRWMQDTLRLVRGADGSPLRVVGCWADITEHKFAEDTLQAAEVHTRALLSAIPDMMLRMSRSGEYLDYKAEGRSTSIMTPEQLIGTKLGDIPMQPALVDQFMTAIGRVLDSDENLTVEYDLEIEGSLNRYEARMSKSGPDEIVSIVRDITDRARSEARIKDLNQRLRRRNRELESANRELESFSYSVSHDLRAPLRAIDGFSMVLERQYGETLSEHARGLLTRVRAAAQRMSGLIDDLLCLSRITRSNLSSERIDISALAAEVIESLRTAQPDRHVETIIAPGMTCFGDPSLLRILFDNLLGNAWKYTSLRPHARIELGTMAQADEQVYFVRDNGAGFDMQYAKKLFSAFQRLHTSHEFPGNGIGLATAARVVQRHGGRIWAEAAVDQGASFYFTLAAEHED